MKKFKSIVVILLILLMVVTVAGCLKKGVSGNEVQNAKKTMNMPEKLENPNITYLDQTAMDALSLESTRIFEQKYGGKVSFIEVIPAEKEQKIISMITSGNSPDIIGVGYNQRLIYIVNNFVQQLNDYFDFNDPIWNMKHMKQVEYKGKFYNVLRSVDPIVLFYNKTLFENNGLKTPTEYVKEGKWTWDTFREAAVKLTQDTDKDGLVDQYGLEGTLNPAIESFVYSNGGEYIKVETDGTVKPVLMDSNTVEGFQFYHDGFNLYKYINPKSGSVSFAEGKSSMMIGWPNNFAKNITDMKYEWDVAPIPTGPNGPKDFAVASYYTYAIAIGANNPEGAAAWIYNDLKVRKEHVPTPEERAPFSEEQMKFFDDTREIATFSNSGLIGSKNKNGIANALKKGTPVITVIEQQMPLIEDEISKTLQAK